MQISSLGRTVAGSETLAISARIAELRRAGREVISFAAGEPDFDTPAFIKEAAKKALDEGYTKYTAAAGAPELRERIAQKMGRENSLPSSAAEVVVTAGAKQALSLAFQVLLEPGDEVLIPVPYWVSFPQQVLLSRGVPVLVETRAQDGFVLRPQSLEAALGERSRVLVLNSPCNPTGAVYPRETLAEVMEIARARDLWVVSDETYESLTYGGLEHVSPASLSADARSRTVVTCSLSKSYAMTGWRVGYLVAPAEVASAASRIASHTTSNVNSIAQRAALAALEGPREPIEAMRQAFDERRMVMHAGLQAIRGLSCLEPMGAFYAFPNVEAYLGRVTPAGRKLHDSAPLADYLLDAAGIALVPGIAFGAEGHLRLSYATGPAAIRTGLENLGKALAALA